MDYYKVLDLIIDSRDVTVGGGSASALAAAMAAGLTGMVARLSVENKGKTYGLKDDEYIGFADELDALAEKLKKGSADDTAAYLGIKNAYAMPKGTDEEKALRGAAIEKAGVAAADVPLRNADNAFRILEITRGLKEKSNPNAGSDLACGEMLAAMAVRGAMLNVEANLPLIKTDSLKEPFLKALDRYKAV